MSEPSPQQNFEYGVARVTECSESIYNLRSCNSMYLAKPHLQNTQKLIGFKIKTRREYSSDIFRPEGRKIASGDVLQRGEKNSKRGGITLTLTRAKTLRKGENGGKERK